MKYLPLFLCAVSLATAAPQQPESTTADLQKEVMQRLTNQLQSLTIEQKAELENILQPLFAVRADLESARNLLTQVRDGKLQADEAAPEVKRLLHAIKQNRQAYLTRTGTKDEKVKQLVRRWMMWNQDKMENNINVLIQLGHQLLNTPGTDSRLIEVLKQSFFGEELHLLSEYPAAELAKAEPAMAELRQCAACMKECIQLLESISSKEEADAAVPRIRQLLGQYKEHQKTFRKAPVPTGIQRKIYITATYTCGFPTIMNELSDAITVMIFDKKCFGSRELEKALHF